MIAAIRAWRERRRVLRRLSEQVANPEAARRASIAYIRETMAFFGYPVDDMTDDEIEAGAMKFAEAARHCGISTDEAARGIRLLQSGF